MKTSSDRSAKFAARRTVANRSSTAHSSTALIATICWARTSSGLRGYARVLDRAGEHPLGDDGGLEQVAAVLREDLAQARLADLVAGAPDPLQAARDRARATPPGRRGRPRPCRCRARGRGGDDRAQVPLLQRVLDLEPLLARDRAVVGADEVLLGELVEPRGEPFGEPPLVHEHDRGAVRADQLEEHRVDRRPDRGASGPPAAGRSRGSSSGCRSRPCPRPGRRPRAPWSCGVRRRRS